jgi:Family of unknown function (DUF6326)
MYAARNSTRLRRLIGGGSGNMNREPGSTGVLDDVKIHVRFKLSSLWTSVMLCYVYGDYFELYVPGKLRSMLDGRIAPLGPVTQGVLVGTTILMAIPGLMVVLSLLLPSALSRIANIVLGSAYSLIVLVVISRAGWRFYVLMGIVEIVLTSLIVWYAWTWPRLKRPESDT